MSDPAAIRVKASAYRDSDNVEVTLRLRIPRGTHIEPHEPPEPFLIPTVVDFDDLEPVRVSYPEPVDKDLGLPGGPLLVYEGGITITARGRAPEALHTIHGTVRFQPCVGGACLPPRKQTWRATIRQAAPHP